MEKTQRVLLVPETQGQKAQIRFIEGSYASAEELSDYIGAKIVELTSDEVREAKTIAVEEIATFVSKKIGNILAHERIAA